MTSPFLVRNKTLQPAYADVLAHTAASEGRRERASVNKLAMQEVIDFFAFLQLGGWTYGIQAGTEDAGAAATSAIDDETAYILADCNALNGMIPLLYEVHQGVQADNAVLSMSMLEFDMAKKRYSSGGTAFTPRNLCAGASRSFDGAGYAANSIVTLAKSAVPESVELARRFWTEDALDDKIGYPGWWDPCIYSVRKRPMAVSYGVSALVAHHGSTTALMTGYGRLEFAQLSTAQLNAS